jgi:hypothetical protein
MAKERAAGGSVSGAAGPKGGDFLLIELASDKSQNMGNVSEFGFLIKMVYRLPIPLMLTL